MRDSQTNGDGVLRGEAAVTEARAGDGRPDVLRRLGAGLAFVAGHGEKCLARCAGFTRATVRSSLSILGLHPRWR